MRRRTVFAVCFIFLFSLAVLGLGLAVCEQGLREMCGLAGTQEAVSLVRGDGVWFITLAGRVFILPVYKLQELLRRLPERFRP